VWATCDAEDEDTQVKFTFEGTAVTKEQPGTQRSAEDIQNEGKMTTLICPLTLVIYSNVAMAGKKDLIVAGNVKNNKAILVEAKAMKKFGTKTYQASRIDFARPSSPIKKRMVHVDGTDELTELPTWVNPKIKNGPMGQPMWYKKLTFAYYERGGQAELLRDNKAGNLPTVYSEDVGETKRLNAITSIPADQKKQPGGLTETPKADGTWKAFRKKGTFKILKYCGAANIKIGEKEPLVKGHYLSYNVESGVFGRMDSGTFKTYSAM
jgi:hypothetical protein